MNQEYDFGDVLRQLRDDHGINITPFSRWRPVSYVHEFVPDEMDLQMVCLFIAKKRPDGYINLLSKDLILHICFYIACRPEQ